MACVPRLKASRVPRPLLLLLQLKGKLMVRLDLLPAMTTAAPGPTAAASIAAAAAVTAAAAAAACGLELGGEARRQASVFLFLLPAALPLLLQLRALGFLLLLRQLRVRCHVVPVPQRRLLRLAPHKLATDLSRGGECRFPGTFHRRVLLSPLLLHACALHIAHHRPS